MKIMVDELPTRKDGKINCIFELNDKYCMLEPCIYMSGQIDFAECHCENSGCKKLCCNKKEEKCLSQ